MRPAPEPVKLRIANVERLLDLVNRRAGRHALRQKPRENNIFRVNCAVSKNPA
jgi:hypothetical protein